ncbi:MAG: hypothetical protein R2911_00125 [Caldilineaceae bacterium]
MNAGRLQNVRSWFLMLTLAVMLAIATFAAPVVLDGVGGTHMVDAASACGTDTGGC